MNAEQFAAEQIRVETITLEWYERLGMDKLGLDVRQRFSEAYADEDHVIIADTQYNWEYRDGAITWYLPRCAALSDKEIGEAAVHEFVHCLIASMESNVPDKHAKLSEFAVETVTQAILFATHTKE